MHQVIRSHCKLPHLVSKLLVSVHTVGVVFPELALVQQVHQVRGRPHARRRV